MKTWAVITQKGGSGKTTIALHLAIIAEVTGVKSAVIDVDPQKSAVKWARIRDFNTPLVLGAIMPEIYRTLSTAERQGVDLAIIDTSPRADQDCLEVSRMADLIIIPVRPSILDIPAVRDTLRLIDAAKCQGKVALVLNAVAPSTSEGRDAEPVMEKLGRLVKTQIGERVDFRRALTGGKGVTEFAPKSKAAQEINALYLELSNLCVR